MGNGYVKDIRTPDKVYLDDALHSAATWQREVDKLNADLKAGRINKDKFWSRKAEIFRGFNDELTAAHRAFLDRCKA
jgi:hypothetical protein